MAVYKTIQQYRKAQERKIKRLIQSGDRSSMTAAAYQNAQAKRMAAYHTGETRRGIRKRKLKSGKWVSESVVSPKGATGFKQNMWANQTPPHDRPRMRWNQFKPTLYGKGHIKTGVPGFWDKATTRTRRQFGRIVLRNSRKALRTRV